MDKTLSPLEVWYCNCIVVGLVSPNSTVVEACGAFYEVCGEGTDELAFPL
jgi:hypothetical protein